MQAEGIDEIVASFDSWWNIISLWIKSDRSTVCILFSKNIFAIDEEVPEHAKET